MTNWMRLHVKSCKICWFLITAWVVSVTAVILMAASCTVPHDFGMGNHLKTICHVFEGDDGYRHTATVRVNSSGHTHESHPWDYDGACEE